MRVCLTSEYGIAVGFGIDRCLSRNPSVHSLIVLPMLEPVADPIPTSMRKKQARQRLLVEIMEARYPPST